MAETRKEEGTGGMIRSCLFLEEELRGTNPLLFVLDGSWKGCSRWEDCLDSGNRKCRWASPWILPLKKVAQEAKVRESQVTACLRYREIKARLGNLVKPCLTIKSRKKAGDMCTYIYMYIQVHIHIQIHFSGGICVPDFWERWPSPGDGEVGESLEL